MVAALNVVLGSALLLGLGGAVLLGVVGQVPVRLVFSFFGAFAGVLVLAGVIGFRLFNLLFFGR